MGDEIALVEYDPTWPGRYQAELSRVSDALPHGIVRRAEHIGSTAVPGMLAKPVVDILLGVDSLEAARRALPPVLKELGYAFWEDNPKKDRLFFVKGLPPNGPRTFHIHVTTLDSEMWERVLFRDYLGAHPEEARRYEQLKRDLAVKFPEDREAYSEGKTEYHEAVVARARQATKEMKASDVLEIAELLEANGIPLWLDGGWGVDALLGKQTRSHGDLDIAVQHKDISKLRKLLEARGYRDVPRDDTKDWNFVLGDGRGHEVDIHSFTFDSEGKHIYGIEYPADSLTGSGSVNGRSVQCISAEHVVRFHTGYELRDADIQDLEVLRKRFGIPVPKAHEEQLKRKRV